MASVDGRVPLEIAIKDLGHRELEAVYKIEQMSYSNPWQKKHFLNALRRKRLCGIVAVTGKHRVIGFVILEALEQSCQVLNLAVHPDFRRRGVGRKMLGWVQDRLQAQPDWTRICLEVRERNLEAQLFMKKCNFKAVEVIRDYYEDTGEDAYRFERSVR